MAVLPVIGAVELWVTTRRLMRQTIDSLLDEGILFDEIATTARRLAGRTRAAAVRRLGSRGCGRHCEPARLAPWRPSTAIQQRSSLRLRRRRTRTTSTRSWRSSPRTTTASSRAILIGRFAAAIRSAPTGRRRSRASDFRADLLATAVEGDGVWSEWRWRGTHADGSRLEMAGVIIFGVRADRIAWARLYVEPVEQAGEGIAAAVRDMSGQ